MLFTIFQLLLDTIASVLCFTLLLRALMQWVRLHPRNPLAPFVFALTDWLVRPLRRFFPGFAGIDWASIMGAVLVAVLLNVIYAVARWVAGNMALPASAPPLPVWGFLFAALPLTAIWLLKTVVHLLMGIVLISVVLSWVNPFAPVANVLNELSAPFMRPLRRLIPMVGPVDLSPLVFLLAMQILLVVIDSMALGL